MTDNANAQHAHQWKRRWEVLHRLTISVAYHRCRERFFDQVDKISNAACALAATSAVVALLGNSLAAQAVSILTAALALVPLVFQPSAWARKHADLAAEFTYLQAKCLGYGEQWTPAQGDDAEAALCLIEAKEPPALTGVVMYCEARQAAALGHKPSTRLSRWQKALMHFIDIDPATARPA